jgi:hypothetical protein
MMQEHFGGDTTHVQASAAKIGVFFDYDGLQPKFTGANGGYITSRPATDDRNIVLSHTALLPQASGPRVTNASPARKSFMAHYLAEHPSPDWRSFQSTLSRYPTGGTVKTRQIVDFSSPSPCPQLGYSGHPAQRFPALLPQMTGVSPFNWLSI